MFVLKKCHYHHWLFFSFPKWAVILRFHLMHLKESQLSADVTTAVASVHLNDVESSFMAFLKGTYLVVEEALP